MGYRRRIFFTDRQKSQIWDRWQRGESMSSIGRSFNRNSSSIHPLIARAGGFRPAERKRSRLALTLAEREEISRGLGMGASLRQIACGLRRAPSTISREVHRNGGRINTGPRDPRGPPGTAPCGPSCANWLAIETCAGQSPPCYVVNGRQNRLRAA